MRKALSVVVGAFLLLPAFAVADSAIPLEPTIAQLATRAAALEAQEASLQSGQPLACAMLFSTSSVSVGQEVILAWGSVGAVEQTKDTENMRATNGAATLTFSKPATWTYVFTFYNESGGSVTCNANIVVTP